MFSLRHHILHDGSQLPWFWLASVLRYEETTRLVSSGDDRRALLAHLVHEPTMCLEVAMASHEAMAARERTGVVPRIIASESWGALSSATSSAHPEEFAELALFVLTE